MARKLTYQDIPFINEIINEPDMIKLIGMGKESIDIQDTFNCVSCYISDDGLDLAIFDRKDLRLYQGHNCFRSKGRQAIKNGKDIIQKCFEDNPNLEIIFGLTPIKYKTTRWFNNMIGFKFIMYEWLESNILAARYEIRRNKK